MPRIAEQKVKLLVLYEILQKRTDETHPMTTGEIISALEEYGITTTRKTVYGDIDTLNRYGFEVLCDKKRSNGYYVADRKFERPEVQILLQAIEAAKFLSDKKAAALSQKVAQLLGEAQAREFINPPAGNNAKAGNEHIYYSIDAITTALAENRKLSFLYFDTDLCGRRRYRKNKSRYEVNPLGMVYSGEYFYLVCYHDKYGDTANYRIDRMDEVRVEEQEITGRKEYEHFDINAYCREMFSMYSGEQTEVELHFAKEYAEIVRDRFGNDIHTVSDRDGYILRTKISVSKTFFAWLTTFEGNIRIIRPAAVREQFRTFVENIIKTLQ